MSWFAWKKTKEQSAATSTKPPVLSDIPELVDALLSDNDQLGTAAAKKLYELCDVAHKQNRVPMICSGRWDVLTPLTTSLTVASGEKLHLTCLALNNLSIPEENKRVMALGPKSKDLIEALCIVLKRGKPGSYLCTICLMNLSFLESNINAIMKHSPISPLDNPDSLLRILEKKLNDFCARRRPRTRHSEEARWACGLAKNLARSHENASLLAKTDIPRCAVDNLRSATTPSEEWANNSMEDFSLSIALNLARWNNCVDVLNQAGAVQVVSHTLHDDGLQGLKAKMTCAFLGADWSIYPGAGKSTSSDIIELMTSLVERTVKNGRFSQGAFRLCTATKAYHDLAVAAAKADSATGTTSTLKSLAEPLAIALNLRIVSELILSAEDGNSGSSKPVSDAISAEYAVGTILMMLPVILEVSSSEKEMPHRSGKIYDEISALFLTYSEIDGTSADAKAKARNASEKVKEASGAGPHPVLETSHSLWLKTGSVRRIIKISRDVGT